MCRGALLHTLVATSGYFSLRNNRSKKNKTRNKETTNPLGRTFLLLHTITNFYINAITHLRSRANLFKTGQWIIRLVSVVFVFLEKAEGTNQCMIGIDMLYQKQLRM